MKNKKTYHTKILNFKVTLEENKVIEKFLRKYKIKNKSHFFRETILKEIKYDD